MKTIKIVQQILWFFSLVMVIVTGVLAIVNNTKYHDVFNDAITMAIFIGVTIIVPSITVNED